MNEMNTYQKWIKYFPQKIKRILEEKNMLQDDLASAMNMTPVSISRYVTGKRVPKVTTIINMSKALGVTVEELTNIEKEISE